MENTTMLLQCGVKWGLFGADQNRGGPRGGSVPIQIKLAFAICYQGPFAQVRHSDFPQGNPNSNFPTMSQDSLVLSTMLKMFGDH